MRLSAALAIVLVLICAACGGLPSPSPSATEAGQVGRVTHPDILVITGVGADHVVITEPLVEVIPPEGGEDATMDVEFRLPEMPTFLGIEGARAFVSAHLPDGTAAVDRMVGFEGSSVRMPPGDYLIQASYRPCDGSCGLLDPAEEFCAVELATLPAERYALVVTVDDHDSADCVVSQVD